jgi:hypothetical protein
MRQSLVRVLRRDIGVLLLPMIDGRLEMRDAFFGMGIVLRLFGRLGMRKRGFGMRHEHVGMTLLAVGDGFLRVADGLRQMILCECEPGRRQSRVAMTESESENLGIHDCIPPCPFPFSKVEIELWGRLCRFRFLGNRRRWRHEKGGHAERARPIPPQTW